MNRSAIIIGAGVGGLASAIRLTREGWKVRVLEKNVKAGGRVDCHGSDGFLWDMGPTQVIMPFVLRELFEYAGQEIENYLEMMPVDPVCRYFFPDGKIVHSWAKLHHFQIEVARREKDLGQAFENYMRYAQGLYDTVAEGKLHPEGGTQGQTWRQLFRIPTRLRFRTMAATVQRFFKNPYNQQLMLNFATSRGSHPWKVPHMANLLPYLQFQGGSWYIRGGMYRLSEALEKCARDLGVEIEYNTEVTEILVKSTGSMRKPQACGVAVQGGANQEADLIVCNADLVHAWTRLIQIKAQPAMLKRLHRRALSTSSFLLMLGVRKRHDKLCHHNVIFSSDLQAEYDDIFSKKRVPLDPTLRISISSRTDPTQSPPGQDNYLISVQVPPLEPDQNWEKSRDSFRDSILDKLEKFGLENIRNDIVCQKIITPSDLASRTHAYRGAAYGFADHSGGFWDRPQSACQEMDRLYFVGASTHPGGGIPFVLLSAQWLSRAVQKDLGKTR